MVNPEKDWNINEDFFRFSRGRFVCNEVGNMSKHAVRFDMNELARIAANAISAKKCVKVEKCPDGMYNKAYIFTMDDNRQVVGKVPNPNAGLAHFTTASEVATMDFVRNVLGTPVPRVYTWSSRARNNSVGAEYIIMEKVPGVPLLQVWGSMKLTDKLQLIMQLFRLQKSWLSASFTRIGSLYYAKDVEPGTSGECLYLKNDEHTVKDERFVIGPATGRDWMDEERSTLKCDRGPWLSALEYYRAVLRRESDATKHARQLPKQMVMVCGLGLYEPTHVKKLEALDHTAQIVEHLLPPDPSIRTSHLWHNDLHEENVFVDPENPTNILGIIDWQSTQTAPLFEQSIDPAILEFDGPGVESLEEPHLPDDFNELSAEKRAAELKLYHDKALLVAYRRLIQRQVPLKNTIEFQATPAFDVLRLSRRIFEIGEAHLCAIIGSLAEDWSYLDAGLGAGKSSFPLHFSEPELQDIQSDAEAADAGIQAMSEIKRRLGRLWPEKGAVQSRHYEETKVALRQLKEELTCSLALDAGGKKTFEEFWPFDS